MIKIEKDVASFIRSKLPTACIHKTMKTESKRGSYYVEETSAVMRLISQYRKNNERVIEEYPVSK